MSRLLTDFAFSRAALSFTGRPCTQHGEKGGFPLAILVVPIRPPGRECALSAHPPRLLQNTLSLSALPRFARWHLVIAESPCNAGETCLVSYALGGIGAGAVYGACVGTALTVIPINRMIANSGYQHAFIVWGMIQGIIVMLTAQLKPIATSYDLDKAVVLLGVTALEMALMLDRFLNGVTWPFWGWVTDRIGHYNTMAIAFGAEASAILALLQLVHQPI